MTSLPMVDPLPTPSLEYGALSPALVVLGGAVISVLIEGLAPRTSRRFLQLLVAGASLLLGMVFVVFQAKPNQGIVAAGSVAVDGPTIVMQFAILLVSLLVAMLVAENKVDPAGDAFAPRAATLVGSHEEVALTKAGWEQTEVWPLFLFSVFGMLLFPAANDLLMLFVALEVLSLPLYLLAGMARRRRLLSQEAALKYFLLGAFASAFVLYGSAMLYGYAGSMDFAVIADTLGNRPAPTGLMLLGVGLLAIGLLFKVGAVPFHMWTPDVYHGSPTAITAFMAAGVKIAGFGALLRVFYAAVGGAKWNWEPAFWAVAAITMLVGVLLALTSTQIKRVLAYSSIAHAGFLLLGVIAFSAAGLSSSLFYLVAYGLATVGAFAITTLVRDPAGDAGHLSSWAGLGKRSPLLAGAFAFFLLAFAGIPLTSGFTSKFAIFAAAIAGHATPLVIVAVIASAISAFFYLRVIVLMFFSEPREDGPEIAAPSLFTKAAIVLTVAATVILGVFPQWLYNVTDQAGLFLR